MRQQAKSTILHRKRELKFNCLQRNWLVFKLAKVQFSVALEILDMYIFWYGIRGVQSCISIQVECIPLLKGLNEKIEFLEWR